MNDNCSACGRSLEVDGMGKFIGVCITLECKDEANRAALEHAMQPYSLDTTYSVCFPCWLKSLGIKP